MSCRTYDPCLDSKLNQIGSYASVARQSAQSATASAAAAAEDAAEAAESATNSANSASEANNYLTQVTNIFEDFDERYLGAKSVAPTVDNQGNPLQEGALYWNSVSDTMYVWDGTSWVTATGFNETTPFLATGTTTQRNLETRFADVVNVKDFGAIGDGVTDDTAAIQAALNAAANKKLIGNGGDVYKITSQLELKSGTHWDFNGSTLKAFGTASSSFFSLWEPENGANEFSVVNQKIDCNNVLGMIGFIVRIGSHNGRIDGFIIENFLHQKGGVDGGRGFVVESIPTILDNSNIIITNGICRNGYMGYAFQSGDALGDRHNLIINNITVENCDVVHWIVGNTANYPHSPTEMQAIISNITAHNCGLSSEYTNNGGAFVSDRACNIKLSNIVLSNDPTYGTIDSVWHGNGSQIEAEITFYGDCNRFWYFQPYKESDFPPSTEFTIQDSELTAVHYGSCNDIAMIGSATDSLAINVRIFGRYDTVNNSVVHPNLRQDDIWFDVFEVLNNSKVIGRGSDISSATFLQNAGRVGRYGKTCFGLNGNPSYSPTVNVIDDRSDMTGGLEIDSFKPQLKFRDFSTSAYSMAIMQDGTIAKMSFDETPSIPNWIEFYNWDKFAYYPSNNKTETLGKNGNSWENTFTQWLSLEDNAGEPPNITGKSIIYIDTDGDLKIKFGDGTIKTIVVD